MATAVVTPGEKPAFHVPVETYDASCTLKVAPFTVPLTDPKADVLVPLPQPIARNRTRSGLRMASQCSPFAAHGIRRMAYNDCRRPPGPEAHPRSPAGHAAAPLPAARRCRRLRHQGLGEAREPP